jgi:hypothetical protein
MTTIGSTAYYASTARYGATEKTNSSTADELHAGLRVLPDTGTGTTRSSSIESESVVDNRPSSATTNFQGKLFGIERTFKIGDDTVKGTPIWELPEAEYQEYLTQAESSAATLESQYTERPWDATVEASLKWFPVSPATQPYATVTVDGKVAATIDNQGVVSTENDQLGEQLSKLLLSDVDGTNGPDLAQARADQIAALLGGQVTKSDTAMTQLEFNSLPSLEVAKGAVDWEALMQDPLYTQLQSLKEKRADYLNQQ